MIRLARRLAALACALAWTTAALAGNAGEGEDADPVRSEQARGPLTLEVLMGHLAASRGVKAEFREEKEISLLQAPLTSEGTIYIVPPGRMARYTREPSPATLVIDGDRLSMRDPLGGQDVDLGAQTAARQFVDHLLLLFSGDLEGLRERFELDFAVDGERWTLTVRPRSGPVKRLIESIAIDGDGSTLLAMSILEKDGDRTVTTYANVETDRSFSDVELARIFPEEPQLAPDLP